MKKIMYLLLLFSFFIVSPVFANDLNLSSNNAVLYNLNDNKIMYEKNKDEKVSVASLTKLMTALVAVENINDINQKVKLEKIDYDRLIKQDASSSSLKRDTYYTYEDLLYGLILESGADCANALARLTFGSEESFVIKMNQKAEELGMSNTKFANPIGLDDKNNYSSVNDIAILLKEDLKNPVLEKVITSLHHTLTDGTTINHTIYFYMDRYKIDIPSMRGGKTGYELKSGYALASIATKNDTTLILVSSNAKNKPDHVIDAKKTYDYFFENYDYIPIIKKGSTIVTLNTKHLNKKTVSIKADKDIMYYINKDYNHADIKTMYEGKKTITLSDRYNRKIGNLKIYYQDKQIMNYPVILNQKVYPDVLIVGCLLLPIIVIIVLTIVIRKKRSDF